MAEKPEVKRIKEELEKDTRDVSDLWNDALRNYKGIVGEGLVPKYKSVEEMIQAGTEQMNAFHKFRHNDKKVDKLRSLFASNLDYIEKGAQQIIAAAAPAFPPAAAIGTALTYMLSACRQVSADYDVVTAFFEDMNAFLQRITILESRLPAYPAYRNCLMDVFTSVLEMCGFATKYIQLRRFKKWILNMIRGEDGELAGARKKMDTRLSRLQTATEYAILGNTEKLQTMSAELKQNDEMQTLMLEEQTKMLETVIEGQDNVRNDLKDIRKLLSVFQEQKREESHAGNQKSAKGKPPTSSRVRTFFWDLIDPIHEYHSLKESLIPEMSTWIFDEPDWATWVGENGEKETSKLLYIAGPPGAGKSHIAVTAHDRLVQVAERDADRKTCVTQFYIRETRTETTCFYHVMNWLAIQVAEWNDHFCERINAEISREDLELDVNDWKDIWTKILAPLFPKDSPFRLQIVLDGLDELAPDGIQRVAAHEFCKSIAESELNVTLLCTTRSTSTKSTFPEQLDKLGSGSISITKEKQLPDLKTLVWHHLDNDVGLKKLSQYMRQRIASTLEEKADCLLYVEHVLRRFNNLNREPLILRHLEKEMPNNLQELYRGILSDLVRKTSPEQRKALKTLFMWLAFAVRPITLSEAISLINLSSGELDLEEELQGQDLARILRIADRVEEVKLSSSSSGEEFEDLQEQGGRHEGASDDWNLPLKFQERSLRDHFRAATFDEDSDSLRTPGFEAHRQIFISLSQIMCKPVGSDFSDKLRGFAASCWLLHLGWVWWYGKYGRSADDQSPDFPTEDQKIELLNAIGAVLTAEGEVINNIENAEIYYESLGTAHLEIRMNYFVEMAKEVGVDKLKESTAAWINDVSENWQKAFIDLTKGHVRKWFSAKDAKSAIKSYWFARSAISFTDLKSIIRETEWNDDLGEECPDSKEIFAMSKAFPDVDNRGGPQAVALLLFDWEYYEDALPESQKALELASSDPLAKFQITNQIANIHYELENDDEAYETIKSALTQTTDIPPTLIRRALVTRAKIESSQSMINEAMTSYKAARLAEPNTPMLGSDLQDLLTSLIDSMYDEPKFIVSAVKSWSPIERVAWMTWKYDSEGPDHMSFQRACGRAKETEFMINTYKEVIGLLDAVDAGAPLRYDLAFAQWKVCGDLTAAKELLNDILGSTSDGSDYNFTGYTVASLMVDAINLLSEILYEEFRTSADPKRKAELLEEMEGIMDKPLVHSISSWKSVAAQHKLMLSRMVKKMGPRLEYQHMLQAAFDVSYEALFDNVNWNDSENVRSLAMVLSVMGGLEKEARILVSAIFSNLDKALGEDKKADGETEQKEGDNPQSDSTKEVKKEQEVTVEDGEDDGEGEWEDDDEGDDDDDDDDESLPSDEGDLDGEVSRFCDGECDKDERRAWKGRTIYFCTICADVDLCEECYQKRQTYNKVGSKPIATVGSDYCGVNHTYLKGPIEGWKGIEDGMLKLEGEEPVNFKDWLKELKEIKWKEAWEEYWLGEG